MSRDMRRASVVSLLIVAACSAPAGPAGGASSSSLRGAPSRSWSKSYGEAGSAAVGASLASDGGLVVLASNAAGGGEAIKIDTNGAVVWDAPWTAADETPSRLAVGASGAVVAGGTWTAADGTTGAFARAWDASGRPAWAQRWTDGAFGDVAIDASGDVAVTTSGATHCVDRSDASRWDAPVSGTLVRFDAAGEAVVAGTSNDGRADKTTVTRIAATGVIRWSYRADDGVDAALVAGSAPRDVVLDGGGRAVVTGYRRYKDDARQPVFDYETQTVALDAAGAALFVRNDQVFQDGSTGEAVAVDRATGRVTVTGVTASPDAPGYQQYMTFQYEGDGTPRWSVLDDWSGAAGHKRPVRVAIDAGGTSFVSGTIDQGPGAATVAYGADGSVSWRTREAGTAKAMALDPGGALYVAGDAGGAVQVTRYAFTA
jgi:hypothetical protein